MRPSTYKALEVRLDDQGRPQRRIIEKNIDHLPPGQVLIEVEYSSLNYKDALSASGHKGVTGQYPHVPGIDAAGTIVYSEDPSLPPGSKALVTGFDLGMNTSGGFAQFIRVPASWVIPLPSSLSTRHSMAYGTAGFTAALSMTKLEEAGLEPADGEILVTGATGGVGSLAAAFLSRAGYRVTAVSGKPAASDFLMPLGIQQILTRAEFDDSSEKPLNSGRWAGVVDSVGGSMLSTALKSTLYGGVITCCGLVASAKLHTTVYPFILRGIRLIGVDSVNCPLPERKALWQKIAGALEIDKLNRMFNVCGLSELDEYIEKILGGEIMGRIVVDLKKEG